MPAVFPFNELALNPELLENLADIGYTDMTLVQAQALPALLAGRDVIARAKTGSGKTAAFGLALLNKLRTSDFCVQGMVLCPTRELAEQVANEIRRLARQMPNTKVLLLCGGAAFGPQLGSLQRSPHIVVGTPGRIHKHLRKQSLELDRLETLVLDEADRMLDMGFEDEINAILKFVPRHRQTLLFSATYPETISGMSARLQRDPQNIDVSAEDSAVRIEQRWCRTNRKSRNEVLLAVLRAYGGALNLVFCNTKLDCAEVSEHLRKNGIAALALHGDLDQRQRNEMLVRFANRSASVLVATDVAARGLDVDDLDAVFNYELPPQPDTYIHRIGRTARAGKAGLAISLVEEREMPRLAAAQAALRDGGIALLDSPDAAAAGTALIPPMVTIQISGGRKSKLRPGDVLGALTADGGVSGEAVGSIDLFDNYSYVAVSSEQAKAALQQLSSRPIKGRKYRARLIRNA